MSGQPADRWHKFKFRTPPAWIWALAPLALLGGIGIVVVLIVQLAVARKADGVLPLHHSRRALLLWLRWGTAAAVVLGLLLFVVGLVANSGAAVLLGALVFVAAVLFAAFGLRWIGPRAKVNEVPGYPMYWLELRNVHPDFAQAVAQMQASRQAAYFPQPEPYHSGPR